MFFKIINKQAKYILFFFHRALKIFKRKRIQGKIWYAVTQAKLCRTLYRVHTLFVAERRGQSPRLCPSSISIHNTRKMFDHANSLISYSLTQAVYLD
jgi:hypothetical protein